MRDTSSFMVVNFPLDTQLDGFDGLSDLGAGNTIVFTHIPAGVAVYFAIDNNSQSKIQALQGMQIKTNHGGIYFTTVGTSSDPMILAHWASDDMEIITPPISTFESLNGFGLTAFNQLSKAMNPYEERPTITRGSASGALVTMLSKTLTCAKIKVKAIGGFNIASHINHGAVAVYINGTQVFTNVGYNGTAGIGDTEFETIITSGDILRIDQSSGSSTYISSFQLEEFNLKA